MYSKEIEFRDYTIVFDYTYHQENGLYLRQWVAYVGEKEEMISCVDTSTSIENYILKFLDKEYSENGFNYREEYMMFLEEKRDYMNQDR